MGNTIKNDEPNIMTSLTSTLLEQLEQLVSEGRNPNTMQLDRMSIFDVLTTINKEDSRVTQAVAKAIPQIEKAVEFTIESFQQNGRLIYVGAGTSGRLGILDAVECRPTFSVPDDMVVGLIAGGEKALIHAVEGAEDSPSLAMEDLKNAQLTQKDTVIGIAASGRTPYVIGAIDYANEIGCNTASIVCNPSSILLNTSNAGICVEVGPECLTGSTRMKSGTAQKLVLNMISTTAMIKMGKVYENLMVDVNATNEKLKARAIRIVMQATQCNESVAQTALKQADNKAKLAILMILTGLDADQAQQLLFKQNGHLREALTYQAS